jgi:hypothetical protein
MLSIWPSSSYAYTLNHVRIKVTSHPTLPLWLLYPRKYYPINARAGKGKNRYSPSPIYNLKPRECPSLSALINKYPYYIQNSKRIPMVQGPKFSSPTLLSPCTQHCPRMALNNLFLVVVLCSAGIKFWIFHILGKCSATELHPQPMMDTLSRQLSHAWQCSIKSEQDSEKMTCLCPSIAW